MPATRTAPFPLFSIIQHPERFEILSESENEVGERETRIRYKEIEIVATSNVPSEQALSDLADGINDLVRQILEDHEINTPEDLKHLSHLQLAG